MIPSSFLYEVLHKCGVKTSQEHGSSFWHFPICKRVQLPATRITEQPTLLTKSKINRPCYNFLKYFREKRAGKSRTRSRPRI